jgi:hypothetical protein
LVFGEGTLAGWNVTKPAATILFLAAITWVSMSVADDETKTAAPAPAPSQTPAKPATFFPRLAPNPDRPTQSQSLIAAPVVAPDAKTSAADSPKFTANDRWLIAGYNNDEVIYQVLITSQDTRIIRCTTEIHGFYFDNGKKQTISDRQITTVFPNQPTQAGTWLDMDQPSGATYSVHCHPL